ncbi:MAG: hypothetical protein ACYTEP_03985 [Planctomycetota bacterium]
MEETKFELCGTGTSREQEIPGGNGASERLTIEESLCTVVVGDDAKGNGDVKPGKNAPSGLFRKHYFSDNERLLSRCRQWKPCRDGYRKC